MNDNEQIYSRVLGDLSFMQQVLALCDQQPDEFPSQMLYQRINQERIAFGVEKDTATREAIEKQRLIDEQREYKSE